MSPSIPCMIHHWPSMQCFSAHACWIITVYMCTRFQLVQRAPCNAHLHVTWQLTQQAVSLCAASASDWDSKSSLHGGCHNFTHVMVLTSAEPYKGEPQAPCREEESYWRAHEARHDWSADWAWPAVHGRAGAATAASRPCCCCLNPCRWARCHETVCFHNAINPSKLVSA